MAKLNVNIGLSVNDKTGDTLRTAFDKINQNFTELYTLTGGTSTALTELAQDYAAPLFNHASHTNITATYDDANNKILLTGVAAQVQSNWNASSGLGQILNKPTIPTSFSSLVNGSYTLSLGSTGNTTFPTGLVLGAPRGPNTVNFTAAIDKSFQIETGNSTTSKLWSFGTDGDTTLPSGAVVKTTSGHLTIKGQEYVFIDSATNGQINIGTSSGVGAVVLGSKSRGTNVVVDDLQVANGVYEFFSSLADATGVVTHNCSNGHIFYHTSPDANWTVNLTNLLDTWDRSTSVTLIITQGATGYYPSAVQIAGVAQTIKWRGVATPTPSTNRTDVVTFSIINVSGTYTVLGQLTGF